MSFCRAGIEVFTLAKKMAIILVILKHEMCNLIRVGWYLGRKENNTTILTLTNHQNHLTD